MTKAAEKVAQLPSIRSFMQQADLTARKSLGQNFLFDLNLTGRIAESADLSNGTVFEIGPGPGGLTRALILAGAKKVIAIEKDRRAIAFLNHLVSAADGTLELVEGDALKSNLWELSDAPRQIIANLPYNIATPLLINWLSHAEHFTAMTLMFQREVAERITAAPGDSHFGRLSVLANWRADTQILFDIPPEAFSPPPKIISSVVRLLPRDKPLYPCRQAALEQVTQIAFSQRRKMLRASFKKHGGEPMLSGLGINPELRPQDLDIVDFCRIAEFLDDQLQ